MVPYWPPTATNAQEAWAISTFRIKVLDWLLEPLGEFVRWTSEELDFRIEPKYLRELRRTSEARTNEYIPEDFEDYSTARVLVSTRR